MLDFASDGRDAGIGVVTAGIAEDLIAAHRLASDQADAVRRLTLGGEQLICFVGPAGTGKTRTVGAAADIWQTAEIPVRGLAVSAVAAEVLRAEAGIAADTLAKLLYEHDRPGGPHPPYELQRGEVFLVDEASQVATADFARLVRLAEDAGAKIVAVGDYRQLGSVDAGGLFRLLAHDAVSVELTGVWRFEADWEKEASLRLRSRDTDVLAEYDDHGRLHGGRQDEMVDAAFRQWVDARAARQSVVVMGDDHATVDALAMRVRAMRVHMGEVESGGVAVGEQVVGYGDEIVTLRNDRRLVTDNDRWVRNGDRWVIERRRGNGALGVRSLEGRGRVWLPAGYVAEHVALAYAVTLQKAQGVTVDRGVLLADEATTDLGLYVGMTRGRQSNDAFVVCAPPIERHGGPDRSETPAEVLTTVLQRDAAERSGTEALREELSSCDSFDKLYAQLDLIDESSGAVTTDDRAAWLACHPDIEALRQEIVERIDILGESLDIDLRTIELPGIDRAAPEPPQRGAEPDIGLSL